MKADSFNTPPPCSRRTWGWWTALAAAALAGCSSTLRSRPGTSGGTGPEAGRALNHGGDLREALLARTMLVVNTPYTYGGNSPEGGFDCSGLIQWAVRGITEAPPSKHAEILPLLREQRGDEARVWMETHLKDVERSVVQEPSAAEPFDLKSVLSQFDSRAYQSLFPAGKTMTQKKRRP